MRQIARPLLLALVAVSLLARPDPARAADDPNATETLGVRPFSASLDVSGTLAPADAVEVSFEGDVYGGPLEVVEAAPAKAVRKGEVLVRFQEEEATRQLRDAERELTAARTRLEKLETDTRHKKEATDLRTQDLEEKARRADAALERFREEEKPQRIAQAELGLQAQGDRVQEQADELEQLEKMYKSDDLIEDTEEIVLKRARRSLDRARRYLDLARDHNRTFLEVELPDQEKNLEMDASQRREDLASWKAGSQYDLDLAGLALDKARDDLGRQKSRLGQLRQDVDHLRVVAPTDGYAVPGRFQDGKWQDVGAMTRLLSSGGSVKPGQVLYTIFTRGDVRLETAVAEKDLDKLRTGLACEVVPAIAPELTLPGKVESVVPVVQGGQVSVVVALTATDTRLVPGGSAKAKITWQHEEAALTVPASAIRTKDGRSTVWVVEDGKPVPHEVKVGEKGDDGRVRILDGLTEGQVVRVNAPEEKP